MAKTCERCDLSETLYSGPIVFWYGGAMLRILACPEHACEVMSIMGIDRERPVDWYLEKVMLQKAAPNPCDKCFVALHSANYYPIRMALADGIYNMCFQGCSEHVRAFFAKINEVQRDR